MELSTAYKQLRQSILEEGIEQGRQEGRQEGRLEVQRQFIENFLTARFGSLDETLTATIEPLLELPPQDLTRLMLELSNLEREEFLARLQSNPEQ